MPPDEPFTVVAQEPWQIVQYNEVPDKGIGGRPPIQLRAEIIAKAKAHLAEAKANGVKGPKKTTLLKFIDELYGRLESERPDEDTFHDQMRYFSRVLRQE